MCNEDIQLKEAYIQISIYRNEIDRLEKIITDYQYLDDEVEELKNTNRDLEGVIENLENNALKINRKNAELIDKINALNFEIHNKLGELLIK